MTIETKIIKPIVLEETIDGVEYVVTKTPKVDKKAQIQKMINNILNNPMLLKLQEELNKLQ